eukprot:175852-Rhodomonas_salina.1
MRTDPRFHIPYLRRAEAAVGRGEWAAADAIYGSILSTLPLPPQVVPNSFELPSSSALAGTRSHSSQHHVAPNQTQAIMIADDDHDDDLN